MNEVQRMMKMNEVQRMIKIINTALVKNINLILRD
jgi:hypothetical protein